MSTFKARNVMSLFAVASCLMPLPAEAGRKSPINPERALERAEREVLKPWQASWERLDATGYCRLLSARVEASPWPGPGSITRERDGIAEAAWPAAAPIARDSAALCGEVKSYLSGFKTLSEVRLTAMDTRADGSCMEVDALLDARGTEQGGALRTDRGLLKLRLCPSGKTLAISGLRSLSVETLTARERIFSDVTAAAGLVAVDRHPRREAIRRGGFALIVDDMDGDGLPDVYAGGSGRSQAFRNRGDGTFEDVTERSGLGQDKSVKAALLADMDGDGKPDLVTQRFVEDEQEPLRFYRNEGSWAFRAQRPELGQSARHDRAMSMTAADFNRDGRMDLYVGYPGVKDFTDDRPAGKAPLATQAIYINNGNWKFSELESFAQFDNMPATYPHSAIPTDVNSDGYIDIVVVDDRGGSSRLFLNSREGKFELAEMRLGLTNKGWGMMTVAGDYDADGIEDLFFTNIDLSAGRRLSAASARGESAKLEAEEVALLKGNRLFRGKGDGTFEETTTKAGVGWAGEAPAGAQWVDYNNDGQLDLYVANGLWSAGEKDYARRFIADRFSGKTKASKSAAPNPVMRELLAGDYSFGGYQRNRMFRNNSDGTFTEVAYLLGVDRIEDGYMAATADYDKDGRVDLVLRNADAANEGSAMATLLLLRNVNPNGNKSLTVFLRGRERADGFGAKLTATIGKRSYSRVVRPLLGAVQSEAAAVFGLAGAEKVDALKIEWPSGRVDVFRGLEAGRFRADEGAPALTTLAAGR